MDIMKFIVQVVEVYNLMILANQNSLVSINGDSTLKNVSIVVQRKVMVELDQS